MNAASCISRTLRVLKVKIKLQSNEKNGRNNYQETKSEGTAGHVNCLCKHSPSESGKLLFSQSSRG